MGSNAAKLAETLTKAKGFKAKDELAFLNTWTYKLGAEYVVPFSIHNGIDANLNK